MAALRRYLGVSALGNLVWETAQLPLYTIWQHGSLREKVIAVAHCTAGDILIAIAAGAFGIIVARLWDWPAQAFGRAALLTIGFGLVYTAFSEWLNTTVRDSWSYSDLMLLIPGLDLGLSPALQWLVIPSFALWAARGRRVRGKISKPG